MLVPPHPGLSAFRIREPSSARHPLSSIMHGFSRTVLVRTFAYEDSLGPASPYTMFARVDGLVVYCRFKNSWIRVSCTAAPTSRRHLRVYLQYPFVKSAHMIDNPRPILASVLVLLDSFSTQNLLVSCAMQSISAHDCREGWYPWSSLLAHACDWLVVCIGRKIEPYW